MLAAGYRWLPLAAENRDTEGVGLSHFFHIRCFGVCYCGGKVVVLGVEAVCRRGVVDQRVLTLLTSMQVLGPQTVRGGGSTRRPNCNPPSGVAQGDLLIPVKSSAVGVH